MPILTREQAEALARRVLSFVTAAEAAVTINGGPTSHLRFAQNTVTTSGTADDLEVAFTAYYGKRRATANGNETDDASLKRLVMQAEKLARIAPEDPEHMPLLGPQKYETGKAYAESAARMTPQARSEAAGKAIRQALENKVAGAGFYINRGQFVATANSKDLFAYLPFSSATFTMSARTPEGGGSGYAAGDSFDAAQVDTESIARTAVDIALRSRHPTKLEPGTYATILSSQAMADLFGFFAFALAARSADEGRSVFSGPGGKSRTGEKMFPEQINLYTDPQHPVVPGGIFTESGLPSRRIDFVRRGVLENLVYSRYWAQKQGKEPTGSPANLILDGGTASLEEMIGSTERGLLVTRFWYIRPVNPQTALLTGLTRDGLFYIEKGKVQYPVMNFRFNESPVELLRQVEMLGPQRRVVSSEQGRFPTYLPSVKVKAFRFTSLSEAV